MFEITISRKDLGMWYEGQFYSKKRDSLEYDFLFNFYFLLLF